MQLYSAIKRDIELERMDRDSFLFMIEESYNEELLSKSQYDNLINLLDNSEIK